MGIVKFLFITILVMWVIRMLLKLVFPLVLRNIFNNMQQQANGAQQAPRRPEGSISIDYMPPKPKPGNVDKLGDFVDYEEVK
ncbi:MULTISPECIES: DUF4834 domain-containing protein [unclassified Pedobacter]|jgi:hypothetical protein|uniref:DUF4834 domain-containing protein n=1 Tax=unclassified Pedobacter TaxID=2628915 RepID=UPI000D37C1CB|nr:MULTISPECIES: DUF4834 domain-containing protein [unclassified Pedobacter]PTT03101.1 DUF4834 domain-containing protein [Pedobacter sp. HMWF019]HWW37850.1 hypothetical protein [Pedobacter sp.]